VRSRLQAAGLKPDPPVVRFLVQRAGQQMPRLKADVTRLILYAAGRSSVTLDDARAVAGAALAADDWAVKRAVERRDVASALRELALALDEGARPEMILGQLRLLARAVPPARAAQAVDAIFRTDLDLKSSAGDPRVLLERLVMELCGVDDGAGVARPPRPSSSGRG
jgi:DNA polymerase III delta subunit